MAAAGAVIAVGNLKGEVGKSTLAVNLGCALAVRGLATVVVDADPQLTAAAWTRRRRLPCPADPRPVRDLAAVGGWLEGLAEDRRRHDRVVVDLPATLSPVLVAALLVADAVLVPTSPSPVDLEATRRTVRRAMAAAAERGDGGPAVLAVPMLVRRDWLGRVRDPSHHRHPPEVASTPPIGFDPAFARAFARGDWIGGCAPRSRAHRELLAVADRVEAVLAALGPEGVAEEVPQEVRSLALAAGSA